LEDEEEEDEEAEDDGEQEEGVARARILLSIRCIHTLKSTRTHVRCAPLMAATVR